MLKMGSTRKLKGGVKLVWGVLRKHHLSYNKEVSQKKELGKKFHPHGILSAYIQCHNQDSKQTANVDIIYSKGHMPPSLIFIKVITIIDKIINYYVHKTCWEK